MNTKQANPRNREKEIKKVVASLTSSWGQTQVLPTWEFWMHIRYSESPTHLPGSVFAHIESVVPLDLDTPVNPKFALDTAFPLLHRHPSLLRIAVWGPLLPGQFH